MTSDQITWLGIVISVAGLVGGFFIAKTIKKRSQRQSVQGGSTAIQSGRDTKIAKSEITNKK